MSITIKYSETKRHTSKKFQFSAAKVFSGHDFYEKYKHSEFLKSRANINRILWRGHELRWRLKEVSPGDSILVDGMFIKNNMPLMVKKRGFNDRVTAYDFTFTRLCGLVAAYVFENRQHFLQITCTESKALGLVWDNQDFSRAALYLSAISGTEHFVKQFHYFPLICALRKYQLEKYSESQVMKVAKIEYLDGRSVLEYMSDKLIESNYLWEMFPGNRTNDKTSFQKYVINHGPMEIRRFFGDVGNNDYSSLSRMVMSGLIFAFSHFGDFSFSMLATFAFRHIRRFIITRLTSLFMSDS